MYKLELKTKTTLNSIDLDKGFPKRVIAEVDYQVLLARRQYIKRVAIIFKFQPSSTLFKKINL